MGFPQPSAPNSTPGKGSRFIFDIPFSFNQSKQPALLSDLKGFNVLIVDDNATNRKILQHYFSNWGLQHQSVEDGQQALQALYAGAFDLAVIDMQMPVMDGVSLAKAIRADATLTNTRLLMLSSSGRPEETNEIDVFLLKPVRQTLLFKKLAQLLTPKIMQPVIPAEFGITSTLPQFDARVLLVEDSPINQKVFSKYLQKMNLTADVCNNGKEALSAINDMDYDLAFMDCQMPVMDGYTATEEIRKWEQKNGLTRLPIIALTAKVMPGDREACLQAGMDDYLAKPTQQKPLAAMLLKWLQPHLVRDQQTSSLKLHEQANNSLGKSFAEIIEANARQISLSAAEYHEYLNDFYQQYSFINEELLRLLKAEKFESAHQLLHSFKGVCGNLGFQHAFNLCNQLELRVVNKHPDYKTDYITFENFIKPFMNEIKLHLEKSQIPQVFSTVEQIAVNKDLLNITKQLRYYLGRHSSYAKFYYQKMLNCFGAIPNNHDLMAIEQAMIKLDYDLARQFLDNLETKLHREGAPSE